MENITKSATKIVLLLVVLTLCFLMVFGAVTGQIEYRDLVIAFVALLGAMQGFYFAYKGESNVPYVGK